MTTLSSLRERAGAIETAVRRAVAGAQAGSYTNATPAVLIDQQRFAWESLDNDVRGLNPPDRYVHAHDLLLNRMDEYREALGWLVLTGEIGVTAYAAIADQHNPSANDWYRQSNAEMA